MDTLFDTEEEGRLVGEDAAEVSVSRQRCR